MENRLQFLPPQAMEFSGVCQDYLRFTLNRQLLSPDTWADFVRVFRGDSDDADLGWRCEYWGKMMRGACLCYMATGDEALYSVLLDTVRDLLTAQRPDGRFSTYSAERQLQGWDLWGRKYVMTGLMHFLDICRDEALKKQILPALIRHADAVIAKVGSGDGQRAITETSDYWGGVNSCSILEPFMALYGRTKEARYLRFAKYILSTGGCRDGNLIEIALKNEIPPYEYPEVKAYETMSFFEGVLAYYQETGRKEYLKAVLHFFDAVAKTDLTLIGCCGCTHELFDHSAVRQAEPSQNIMQETCVSVTWMRLCARLLLLTGDRRYYGFIERTGYNALYGAVNLYNLPHYDRKRGAYLTAMPFDSYSPLTDNRRGVGVGGLKYFSFGGSYGCCACIASAGIALLPLTAVLQSSDGVWVNGLFSGKVTAKAKDGSEIALRFESAYPREGRMALTVLPSAGRVECALFLRIPDDMRDTEAFLNGKKVESPETDGGYLCLRRVFSSGDRVELSGTIPLITERIGGSVAFRYGSIVLARDENKEERFSCAAPDTDEKPNFRMLPPEKGEMIRMEMEQKAGLPPVLFTDYASCGKQWNREKNKVTVWMR